MQRRQQSRYPRVFDLRPQFYRDGYGYRFGVPAFDAYDAELERAYRQGVEDGRQLGRYERSAERDLEAYHRALTAGYAAFEAGDYGAAARNFLLAATLNQGDPVSRLNAAHAQAALGDYEPAVRLLLRAFELQPRVIYLPLDIRGAYRNRGDFTQHLNTMRLAAENNTGNADLWFLLGYYYYYSDHPPKAADALARAAELRPEEGLFGQLADLARLTTSGPADHQADRKAPAGHTDR